MRLQLSDEDIFKQLFILNLYRCKQVNSRMFNHMLNDNKLMGVLSSPAKYVNIAIESRFVSCVCLLNNKNSESYFEKKILDSSVSRNDFLYFEKSFAPKFKLFPSNKCITSHAF